MKKIVMYAVLSLTFVACAEVESSVEKLETPSHQNSHLKTAYFASGCFWCVEAVFESVEGVEEAVSGYSGGSASDANYSDVSMGRTNHAESVKVYYDPDRVTYETLLDVFFNSHDPSTLNRQGPDSGRQYRSVIFYQSEEEKNAALSKIKALKNANVFSKITTEVVAYKAFYEAEDYHQNYERLHPNDPYVRNVSIPRIEAFKKKMPEVLK